MKSKHSQVQAKFFDQQPPLSPWTELLVEKGVSLSFKPKEIFLKKVFDNWGFKASDRVLDVGCGQGIYLARLARSYGFKGVGIDISRKSIEYAQKHLADKRLRFEAGEAIKLPFTEASFDKVVSFDALEHIEAQEKAVKEMVRVLKPGGRLLVYTLNKNDKYSLDWIWHKLGFKVYEQAMHKPELFVDAGWIKKLLSSLGMRQVKVRFFDAFFSLGMSEIIMITALGFKKIGLGKSKLMGKLFLGFTSLMSRILYPVIFILDSWWLMRGYSVGLCIEARKREG